MSGTWSKSARLIVAALLVVPAFVVSAAVTSTAAPTQQQVEGAKQRLAQLQSQFETAVEHWNDAKYQLQQVEAKLADAKAMRDAAEKDAARARDALAERAVDAYTGMGSDLDLLLGAQRADWAAQQYAQAVAEAHTHLNDMTREREQIQANLAEQKQLAADLSAEWQRAIAAQQAAAAAAAAQEQAALSSPPPPPPPPSGGGFVPDANASAAQTAVSAAWSVIGAPYVFGAAGPSSFDCSGLTMWAWGQAGVSLPHSAVAQLGTLPHVPLSSVAPGDIIYYGSVSPHVAIYVGGGQIVHARHPGPGGEVQSDSLYGYDTPYAAMRPGV
jgi:peptidoglycan DL-endopeptidase CwlO